MRISREYNDTIDPLSTHKAVRLLNICTVRNEKLHDVQVLFLRGKNEGRILLIGEGQLIESSYQMMCPSITVDYWVKILNLWTRSLNIIIFTVTSKIVLFVKEQNRRKHNDV